MTWEFFAPRPRNCARKKSLYRRIEAENTCALHNEVCENHELLEWHKMLDYKNESQSGEEEHDLLSFKKWWFMREAEFYINGKTVCGTPIFHWGDSIRVINHKYSYFIPLSHIDYIRTTDGIANR